MGGAQTRPLRRTVGIPHSDEGGGLYTEEDLVEEGTFACWDGIVYEAQILADLEMRNAAGRDLKPTP